jgi:hypothetical protein
MLSDLGYIVAALVQAAEKHYDEHTHLVNVTVEPPFTQLSNIQMVVTSNWQKTYVARVRLLHMRDHTFLSHLLGPRFVVNGLGCGFLSAHL